MGTRTTAAHVTHAESATYEVLRLVVVNAKISEAVIRATKASLASTLSKLQRPVIVNSFGRSGSTFVQDTIARSAVPSYVGPARLLVAWAIRNQAWNLQQLELTKGQCFKSHDYPPQASPFTSREAPFVVYMFGDPVDAAASVLSVSRSKGTAWFREHCVHLGVEPTQPETVLDRDALSVEAHFDAWLSQHSWPLAMVRYESLPANIGRLSEFLGVELTLSRWRPRASRARLRDAQLARLVHIYGAFSERLRNLPDFFIPEHGAD